MCVICMWGYICKSAGVKICTSGGGKCVSHGGRKKVKWLTGARAALLKRFSDRAETSRSSMDISEGVLG